MRLQRRSEKTAVRIRYPKNAAGNIVLRLRQQSGKLRAVRLSLELYWPGPVIALLAGPGSSSYSL